MVVRAHNQVIAENVKVRLKSAFAPEVPSVEPAASAENEVCEEEKDPKIVTTEDEIQGFYIVKAILAPVMDINRVVMRDAQSYCAILCDNNNRRPICRLHFNAKQKYVEIFEENKVGTREPSVGYLQVCKCNRRNRKDLFVKKLCGVKKICPSDKSFFIFRGIEK